MRLKTPGVVVLTSRRLSPQPGRSRRTEVPWDSLMRPPRVSRGRAVSAAPPRFALSDKTLTGIPRISRPSDGPDSQLSWGLHGSASSPPALSPNVFVEIAPPVERRAAVVPVGDEQAGAGQVVDALARDAE